MKYSESDLSRSIDLVLYNKQNSSLVFKLWIRNSLILTCNTLMNFYINFPKYIIITYDSYDKASFDKIALLKSDI